MSWSVNIGSIAGTAIRIHVTFLLFLVWIFVAGLATGVWKTREEIAKQWKVAKRFEPKMKREEAQLRMGEWQRALERARRWEQR